MKIGIIGAGWYGCHLASVLDNLGFSVQLFDRESSVLRRASGNNQYRLHMGFHYARHHGTRIQSFVGFQRFIERYPGLSLPVENNIYAVPNYRSLIDYQTYKLIMVSSGLKFIDLEDNPNDLVDLEGCMSTPERVVLQEKARDYFSQRLNAVLRLDTTISSLRNSETGVDLDGERFDYVIDATWGHLSSLPIEVLYEPTLLLYYETAHAFPAVTLVDGPLGSVYPTDQQNLFTLSSVPFTPLGQYATAGEARHALDNVSADVVAHKRAAMEEQISLNVPMFRDVFRFAGIQTSIKTKPVGMVDDRSCHIFQDRRIISVLSGKIDSIFYAAERVLSILELDHSGESGTPGIG